MRCSKNSRELVIRLFETRNTFVSDSTKELEHLPKLLWPGCFSLIRKLCMQMDDFTMTRDEIVFPKVLEVVCENLKHLHELTLEGRVARYDGDKPFLDARDREHASKRYPESIRRCVRYSR